jgi:hypothetical protein
MRNMDNGTKSFARLRFARRCVLGSFIIRRPSSASLRKQYDAMRGACQLPLPWEISGRGDCFRIGGSNPLRE